ncbi:MAG: ATP-binding protein [Alphaproteobacteria bacterium]|nr:ATP-binding protein [Alphaproteobacteria bacterium]
MNLQFERRGGLAVCTPELVEVCLRCQGTGIAIEVREELEVSGRCRCQMPGDRARLFNDAAFPARFAHASFATWRAMPGTEPAFMAAQRWLARFTQGEEQRGLLFCGEPGRGKTHLLVAIARQLILDNGVPVRFAEFGHVLSDLKARMGEGNPETVLRPLAEVPVLVLDELGGGRSGGPTEWEASIAELLVTKRYNADLPMLCATNYSPTGKGENTLGARLGERVWSRLRECMMVVPVRGEDYRAQRMGGAA